ncbi:hypothetical protein ES703_103193 [subsurface metagenome]
MIDHIFADIMKEARNRPGKDLYKKLVIVYVELSERIFAASEGIRIDQRRKEEHEK